MPSLDSRTRETVTVADMVANILAIYDGTDDATRREGRAWYGNARRDCARIAQSFSRPTDLVADIVAALSPRLRWDNGAGSTPNLDAATAILAGQTPRGVLSRSVARARAILAAPDGTAGAIARGRALSGPKVGAFALALRSGGSDARFGAVIDAHAVRGATRGVYDAVARCRYHDVSEAYAIAASMRGERVHDMQAIAWVAVR